MKFFITTFLGLLVLVAPHYPALAVIEFGTYPCNMVNKTQIWVDPDVFVIESEYSPELGTFTSDLIVDIPEARTQTFMVGTVLASESSFSVEYQGSCEMIKYTTLYQHEAAVNSFAGVLFTISEPCNYQASSSKTELIDGSLYLFNMDTGEYYFHSGDEDEFSVSGQITEPGLYIFDGGIRQMGFPENESAVFGEFQFDFFLEEESAVATDTKSWGGIKSLYR